MPEVILFLTVLSERAIKNATKRISRTGIAINADTITAFRKYHFIYGKRYSKIDQFKNNY